MVKQIDESINLLIQHWRKQKFEIIPTSIDKINSISLIKNIPIPADFVKLYSMANGMRTYYPYDIDEEGFYFYSVEQIIHFEDEIGKPGPDGKYPIIIFAEYMHKSWWYGFEENDKKDGYIIGIIHTRDEFEYITNSLSEFIQLYIADSPRLYPPAK